MKNYLLNRIFGKFSKPLIVPEIGINHFGSLANAKKMVDEIKNAGAEIVKVQIHIPEEEMSKEADSIKPGNSNKSIYSVISKNCLSLENEKKLKNYIESKKLIYLATPFSFKAVDWLINNKVKIIKIGSGECNNLPLVDYIASFKRPIILSTGMNNLDTVAKSVKLIEKRKIPYALLHCVNLYPTDYKLARLKRILDLGKKFRKATIGYSDHTIGNLISISALSLGAKIVEKHFRLDKHKKGPDISCSMNKNDLKNLIQDSNRIYQALSSKKKELKEENITKKFAFHSVVSKIDILKNTKFSCKNLTTKRPGIGDFPANKIKFLKNKFARHFIPKNTLIKKKHVK